MKLTDYDANKLLSRMPNLKLSYENIHKKVSTDMFFLIPKGKKHIVWFTYFNDKKVCVFLEINTNIHKKINNVFIVPQQFEKKIVLGTIFYGTLFFIKTKKYFSIENIHYYKGKNVEETNEKSKLSLIKYILENEVKQCFLTNNGIALGLPIIENSFENSIKTARTLPYTIYSIQNRNWNNTYHKYNSTLYKDAQNESSYITFAIKAELTNDVYTLYSKNKFNELEKHSIACIPDLKTSIMMNNIFRDIKENKNLDALEESDDEEEFEKINEDKFVFLEKCVNFDCVFNNKFNKYVPVKISKNNTAGKKFVK